MIMSIIGENMIVVLKKKIIILITENFLGSGLAITTSTMSNLNPTFGMVSFRSTALLTTVPILNRNEYISKLIIR